MREPSFSFWYRFVAPYADAIELDAGFSVAREVLGGKALNTYVGKWFEEICLQWVVSRAREDRLPFVPLRYGKWWGTNPATKQQEDIDVVADSKMRSAVLAGECKWREAFDESDAIANLKRRVVLLGDYDNTWYALFTKHAVSSGTRRKVETEGNWMLVDAKQIYAPVR